MSSRPTEDKDFKGTSKANPAEQSNAINNLTHKKSKIITGHL